jgi:hypothetical protein
MKHFFIAIALLLVAPLSAQQYLTRQGTITFDAGSPLEDIAAKSESASAVYDSETGKLGVQVLMTSFVFKRALMQEHFNENYVESEIYPKASFRGTFYDGRAVGTLTLHGVSKEIDVPASLSVEGDVAKLHTEFPVSVADFEIGIPKTVANKIDKEAKTTVDCTLKLRR